MFATLRVVIECGDRVTAASLLQLPGYSVRCSCCFVRNTFRCSLFPTPLSLVRLCVALAEGLSAFNISQSHFIVHLAQHFATDGGRVQGLPPGPLGMLHKISK